MKCPRRFLVKKVSLVGVMETVAAIWISLTLIPVILIKDKVLLSGLV